MSRPPIMFVNLGGLALLLVALTVPCRTTLGWIDPVTGTMRSECRVFGVPVSIGVKTSAVERWLSRHEGGYTNQWKFTHETSDFAWGGRMHGCGSPPEIYWLRAGEWNDAFVGRSTDAEIGEFVRVMREGTVAEQKRAVEAASAVRIEGGPGRE